MEFKITVSKRIAQTTSTESLICGNDGDTLTVTFDDEWTNISAKTARLVWIKGGEYTYIDVPFTGTSCPLPAVIQAKMLFVGFFAGDSTENTLKTSTPAQIPCISSILDFSAEAFTPDVYRNILDIIANKVDKVEGKGLSTNDYTDEDKDTLGTLLYAADINSQAIANVNEKKVDKVEGKGLSTNDYTNEERDSLDKLSKKFELVEQFTLTEDVTQIYRSQKPNGEAYNFNDVIMTLSIPIIEEGSTEVYGGTFIYIVNSKTDTENNRVVAQGGAFKKGQVGNISVRAKIEGDIVFGSYGASAGNSSNKQAAFTSYSNISMLSAEKITSVLFTFFGQTIFSGTIIKIYAR